MTSPENAIEPARGRQLERSRDAAILHAAVEVLAEVGYDRLTMDAVALRAHAGKATLYRRWASKAELVVDAVGFLEGPEPVAEPNTGSLRGDLLGHCCSGALSATDERMLSVLGGLITAVRRDGDLALAFTERFLRPRRARLETVFARARSRGELKADADISLLVQIIPGQVLFRLIAGDGPVDEDYITRVVDGIVLPAAIGGTSPTPADLPPPADLPAPADLPPPTHYPPRSTAGAADLPASLPAG